MVLDASLLDPGCPRGPPFWSKAQTSTVHSPKVIVLREFYCTTCLSLNKLAIIDIVPAYLYLQALNFNFLLDGLSRPPVSSAPSFTCSLVFRSLVHSFACSLIRSIACPFANLFVNSFVCTLDLYFSFLRLVCLLFRWLLHLFTPSLTPVFFFCSRAGSLARSPLRLFVLLFVHSRMFSTVSLFVIFLPVVSSFTFFVRSRIMK